jgi:hypothetical protein
LRTSPRCGGTVPTTAAVSDAADGSGANVLSATLIHRSVANPPASASRL